MDLDEREWNDPLNTLQTNALRQRVRTAHSLLWDLEEELVEAMQETTGIGGLHLRAAILGIQNARRTLEGRRQ